MPIIQTNYWIILSKLINDDGLSRRSRRISCPLDIQWGNLWWFKSPALEALTRWQTSQMNWWGDVGWYVDVASLAVAAALYRAPPYFHAIPPRRGYSICLGWGGSVSLAVHCISLPRCCVDVTALHGNFKNTLVLFALTILRPLTRDQLSSNIKAFGNFSSCILDTRPAGRSIRVGKEW